MSIPACENANQETIFISHNGLNVDLSIEIAKRMLLEIEFYAKQCWDITQKHIYNVEKLNTIEEVNNYDFTKGYPEKLIFN